MTEPCSACGAECNEEVSKTTRRLLARMGEPRVTTLASMYGGSAPDVLCAACFSVTAGVLNGAINRTNGKVADV